jgi:hypothetical protein
VGNWYRTPAGRLFEVVSVDGDSIEVQYDDGDLEEIDPEYWLEMEPVPASPSASAFVPYDLADDETYEIDRHTLYEVLGTIEYTD